MILFLETEPKFEQGQPSAAKFVGTVLKLEGRSAMTEFNLITLGAAPTVLGLSTAGAVQEAIIQQQQFALKFAMMGLLLERKDAMTVKQTPGVAKMIVLERERDGNVKEEMRIRLLFAILFAEIK